MIYELTIEDNKEKPVIAFLKQLDFVKLKKVYKSTNRKKSTKIQSNELPYFGADVNWDVDADVLRTKSAKKRVSGW